MRRMYSKNQLAQEVQNVVSSGELENVKVFEDIVDKDGHKRFIEGNVALKEIEGVSKTYGKWSLSGSHLLIVLAGTIANGTSLTFTNDFGIVDLPIWIVNKIFPLITGATIVDSKSFQMVDAGNNAQSINTQLRNYSGTITISVSSITLTADRGFRFAYDLLIDDE